MSIGHYHALCQQYRGKAVEIRTHDGRIHRGIIQHVSSNSVYLQPIGGPRNLGGFGFGFWGFGLGFGIAIASIVALSLLPFFFW